MRTSSRCEYARLVGMFVECAIAIVQTNKEYVVDESPGMPLDVVCCANRPRDHETEEREKTRPIRVTPVPVRVRQ